MTDRAHDREAAADNARVKPVLCPILIGRAPEVAVLDEALAAARAGSGGVLFVVGEAGIGKSRLAREARQRARREGMNVLVGRAVEGRSGAAFGPLAEAVQSWLRMHPLPRDPSLEPYRTALRYLAPEIADEGRSEPSQLLVLEGLVRLLGLIAARSGALLVLEDLHWSDADTVAALEYMADNLAEEAVLCLATARSDEPEALLERVEATVARRAARKMELGRLTADEIEAMVDVCVGDQPLPSGMGAALLEQSAGVPFLVEEMLSAYLASPSSERAEGGALDAVPLPPSYRALVRTRLARLGDEAHQVLDAGAIVGPTLEWELIAAMTEFDVDNVLAALGAGVEAQLLTAEAAVGPRVSFSFRHPLVRAAILAELIPTARARLALQAVEVIRRDHPGLPGEWCERAVDLRELAGDDAGAVPLLLEAARRAIARNALGTAEATLERARALIPREDRWRLIGTDELLVEVLSLSGKAGRMSELGEAVLAVMEGKWIGTPVRLAALHLRIARGMLAAGDALHARPHADRALRLAEEAQDAGALANASSLASQLSLVAGDLDGAEQRVNDVLAHAHVAPADAICEARLSRARIALQREGVPEALEHLIEAERDAARGATSMWRIRALTERGSIEAAVDGDTGTLLEARSLAERDGAVATGALIDLELAEAFAAAFELAAAEEAAKRSVDACKLYGLRLLARAVATRAGILFLGGSGDRAGALLEGVPGGGLEDADARAAIDGARTVEALVAEDRQRAVNALEGIASAHVGSTPRGLSWLPGLQGLLSALEGAADLVPEGDALARRLAEPYLALSEAIALGREGSENAANSAFRRGDALLLPFPWRRQLARRLVAEAALEDGWGEAADWLRSCLAFFEGAGHLRSAAACKRLLRRAGAPVPRRGRGESEVPLELRELGVTSREMDVLKLVGQGMSNSEIAERLFLSPRTVETHVRNLMRKVETETRPQLVVLGASWDNPAEAQRS
jgi:DNA-binding CsgD family transcriptional regulator